MEDSTLNLFVGETTALPYTSADIDTAIEHVAPQAVKLLTDEAELTRLITLIDLTTLAGDDTRGRVEKLVDSALSPCLEKPELRCAAICDYPSRVPDAISHMRRIGKHLPVASVAGGFPSGQYPLCSRLMEVKWVVEAGASEIDVVIDRAAALEGNWGVIYDELRQMKALCGSKAHLKVILAVGDLASDENIYKASWAAMLAGADFIKTSTGKEKTNATLQSAFIMCTAIRRYHESTGRRVGFKPAGGIQTAHDALGYRALVGSLLGEEWLGPEMFRIGASSLLDAVLKELKGFSA